MIDEVDDPLVELHAWEYPIGDPRHQARDIALAPYERQEQRVAAYLASISNESVRAGDDPIGFLISSHAYSRGELSEARYKNRVNQGALNVAREDKRRLRQEIETQRAAKRRDLFVDGAFTAHSGGTLPYKIECDALTDRDLATLAAEIARWFRFSEVYGIPRGGTRLAAALERHRSAWGGLLLVDDVLTTGASMEEERARRGGGDDIKGVVLFARSPCPAWITPVFSTVYTPVQKTVADYIAAIRRAFDCPPQPRLDACARLECTCARAAQAAADELDAPSDPGPLLPMTEGEVEIAARLDHDGRPMTEEEFRNARRVPRTKTLRRALGLTQREFAERYRIPLGTLRDWEQGRTEPDQPARAYLEVIARDPEGTRHAAGEPPPDPTETTMTKDDDDIDPGQMIQEAGIAFDPGAQHLDLTKNEKRRTTALMLAIQAHKQFLIPDAAYLREVADLARREEVPKIKPATIDGIVEAAIKFDDFIAGEHVGATRVSPGDTETIAVEDWTDQVEDDGA